MYYSHIILGSACFRRAAFPITETSTQPTAMSTPALTTLTSFQQLQAHSASVRDVHLRQLFAGNPQRFAQMTIDAAGLLLDYSKNRVDATSMALLMDLAR
jgi:glucose-6-phosphate isomerase